MKIIRSIVLGFLFFVIFIYQSSKNPVYSSVNNDITLKINFSPYEIRDISGEEVKGFV